METHEPGLLRFWFAFDLTGHAPPPLHLGGITLDGGSTAYRLLARGAGVTAYDERDALRLLEAALGEPLPPVENVVRQPIISAAQAREVGNPAWRGVWFPRLNMGGPTV